VHFRGLVYLDSLYGMRERGGMNRMETRDRLLAIALSAVAGFVDAVGYGQSGGFFVSFMSGNSTRLGVGIAQRIGQALLAGTLIAAFVTGVVVGTLVARKRSTQQSIVLALVSLALASAGLAGRFGIDVLALMLAALAMGAENATFEEAGEVRIGLTYMTGTLVKMGQRIASALVGGNAEPWLPYLQLWLGLVVGATLGALAQRSLGTQALWLAAIPTGMLSLALSLQARSKAPPSPPIA
jgi:uncharacterized membrane protein YoaK (UPF0700 family)